MLIITTSKSHHQRLSLLMMDRNSARDMNLRTEVSQSAWTNMEPVLQIAQTYMLSKSTISNRCSKTWSTAISELQTLSFTSSYWLKEKGGQDTHLLRKWKSNRCTVYFLLRSRKALMCSRCHTSLMLVELARNIGKLLSNQSKSSSIIEAMNRKESSPITERLRRSTVH